MFGHFSILFLAFTYSARPYLWVSSIFFMVSAKASAFSSTTTQSFALMARGTYTSGHLLTSVQFSPKVKEQFSCPTFFLQKIQKNKESTVSG
jgi:hypothetical protein